MIERYIVIQMQHEFWIKDAKTKRWICNCWEDGDHAQRIADLLNKTH